MDLMIHGRGLRPAPSHGLSPLCCTPVFPTPQHPLFPQHLDQLLQIEIIFPDYVNQALTFRKQCVTIWLHSLQEVLNGCYYGSMADKYIVMLQVLETKKEHDLDLATKVSVQLQLTDPNLRARDRVVKKSEKDGFYTALDVGCVWLERALASK